MSDNLPQEIVSAILQKLPIKALLRCTTVCKSWHSLITSSAFIASHRDRALSINNTNNLLLIRVYCETQKKEHFSLHFDNEILEKYRDLECPLETRAKWYFRIVGACNGLLCLSDDLLGFTNRIVLWNPAIKRYVELPEPSFKFKEFGIQRMVFNAKPYMFVIGFGFDAKSNDYKVVRVAYVEDGHGGWKDIPKVEVYSLKKGSWRKLRGTACISGAFITEYRWSQAFINGAAHWVAFTRRSGGGPGHCSLVLVFDMSKEVFRTMKFPAVLANEVPMEMSISLFGGLLSVYQKGRNFCKIWVMKEYGVVESWTNQFTIGFEGGGLWVPLCLRQNGEILCLKGNDGGMLFAVREAELVSYEPKSKRSSEFKIFGGGASFYADTYRESLVLLDNTKVAVSYSDAKKKSEKKHTESELSEEIEHCTLEEGDISTRLDSDITDGSGEGNLPGEVAKH